MNRWYARQHWVYAGLAALLALDAIVYFEWFRRPVVLPERDPARLAVLERDVADRAAEVARLKKVRELVPTLGPQLAQFVAERFLAGRAGYSRVAADLEDAAAEAGVRLGQVDYDTPSQRDQPDLLRVEMRTSVEGNYRNLLEYLNALERSPRFYLINELTVASPQAGQIRLEMRLATYFRRGQA